MIDCFSVKLPKLSFKQNTLFTYPRSPVCLSELMEYSGVPPSTDVLYTMQLFHRRILIYELTSKKLQVNLTFVCQGVAPFYIFTFCKTCTRGMFTNVQKLAARRGCACTPAY